MAHREFKSLSHDRLADQFDQLMNEYDLERRLETLIDDFLRDIPLAGKDVLDAGCGTGRATMVLAKRGAQVVAMDLGSNLVHRTARRCSCRPVVGDVQACPFSANSFDIVFSTEVIEHAPNPQAALEQFHRLVKPGGYLVLSTPNLAWQWLVNLASKLKLRPYEGYENFSSPHQLRHVLESLGMHVIIHKGIHLAPFQIRPIQPLLRRLDAWGEPLLPWMINQCVLAVKDH